jgi:hypothetical protein
MVPYKIRWILYTTFFIWTGTENGFQLPKLEPYVTNLTGRFILPLMTSVAFLIPDIIQILNDLSVA